MTAAEPSIEIAHREQLVYTLAEAAEIEHNLMCCYLYAAWSLKTEEDDGLSAADRAELKRWERTILSVAVDEMTHLSLVANLMNAVGARPHFERPNFPVAPGYHPAGMIVRLAPFDRDTLQHFIHVERPEGSDEPDGASFAEAQAYTRGLNGLRIMPSAQDYLTVGHLYRSVEQALTRLSASLGEAALFCGDPALQVGPEVTRLPGLLRVTDLKSACRAIETIVEQGEGAARESASGHFQRFLAIRDAFDRRRHEDPAFAPAHPAAVNPVMRRPPQPEGRVWISDPEAQRVLDVGNSVYGLMLRLLAQAFSEADETAKRRMLSASAYLMEAMTGFGQSLARLPANDVDRCHAGLSFAMLRSPALAANAEACGLFAERAREILSAARELPPAPRLRAAANAVETALSRLDGTPRAQVAPAAAPAPSPAPAAEIAEAVEPEIVEGRDLTLIFDGAKCIHARFCVTGAPNTFLANVKGPWLHPDATATDRLVEVAHACPSGAIGYRRKDGGANEAAPPVNLLRLRENGPYAVHADLALEGVAPGFRLTLCRCGASKNKPLCDGSHNAAAFTATGEPETISLETLAIRNGRLAIAPLRNGPLETAGALEILSGTGRVVKRVTQARLCRCGASKTKPFCDGSHRDAGFEAPGS